MRYKTCGQAVRVLIVEDEPSLSRQLSLALSEAAYVTDTAGDGARADFLVRTESYDAVLLDLGLPRMNGLTLLESWRGDGINVPVLVLTARGSWHEKVRGIDSGADDYVAKPFHIEEVLARLRALIRRAAGLSNAVLRSGGIALDPAGGAVTLDGAPVRLTGHEFRVLSYLMHHKDRVVPAGELIDHLYQHDAERDSNTVEVFIGRLRRKLGAHSITTLRGLGYKLGP